jgi:hypothetical protein
VIAADRFPLSPRIRALQAILAKIEPPLPTTVIGEIEGHGR